jgi:hypothetical protein
VSVTLLAPSEHTYVVEEEWGSNFDSFRHRGEGDCRFSLEHGSRKVVITAKAGVQAFACADSNQPLGPGLRRDDEFAFGFRLSTISKAGIQ